MKNLPCSVGLIGQIFWTLLVSTDNAKSRVVISLDPRILLSFFFFFFFFLGGGGGRPQCEISSVITPPPQPSAVSSFSQGAEKVHVTMSTPFSL